MSGSTEEPDLWLNVLPMSCHILLPISCHIPLPVSWYHTARPLPQSGKAFTRREGARPLPQFGQAFIRREGARLLPQTKTYGTAQGRFPTRIIYVTKDLGRVGWRPGASEIKGCFKANPPLIDARCQFGGLAIMRYSKVKAI